MSHDTPEELLPPFWIEICRQPGLWIDDADDESFAVVEDALLHLAAGDWHGLIDAVEDVIDPLYVHFRLVDALGEPLRVSWRFLPGNLRIVQVIYVGHPDYF